MVLGKGLLFGAFTCFVLLVGTSDVLAQGRGGGRPATAGPPASTGRPAGVGVDRG
jgi:hypothetical protein